MADEKTPKDEAPEAPETEAHAESESESEIEGDVDVVAHEALPPWCVTN